MVRSAVRVLVRARPSGSASSGAITFPPDKKSLILSPSRPSDIRPGAAAADKGGPTNYQFKFDAVLHDASQEDVFEASAGDIIQNALQGFNSTIMCYGQTGAGKTFTMSGGKQDFRQRGLIPRILSQLFLDLRALHSQACKVSVSYLEIYNESFYDLLDMSTQPHEIVISENAKGNVTVSGLRQATVTSEGDALSLLFEGETNRVIGEHQLNRESSRSHSIFAITLEMRGTSPDSQGDLVVSKINLVDLAGSERVSKTKSEGLVLREAGHINKSLSILEQVILALSDKSREHVPFRSSRLTHVLKDSLGGNCKTVLIANIWGDAGQIDETLSTARFAQRMMRISAEISPNVVQDSSVRSRQLERQVQELQQELAMHDALANRASGSVTYAPYTPAQRTELRNMVQQFLDAPPAAAASSAGGSIEPLELTSLRHMREILLACKEMYNQMRTATPTHPGSSTPVVHATPRQSIATSSAAAPLEPPAPPRGTSPAAASKAAAGAPPTSAKALRPGSSSSDGKGRASGDGRGAAAGAQSGSSSSGNGASSGVRYVGEIEGMSQSGGFGVAPEVGSQRSSSAVGGGSSMAAGSSGRANGSSGAGGGGGTCPDKHAAFSSYRLGAGAPKGALLDANRAKLKACRRKAKDLALAINAVKRDLDALNERQRQAPEAAQVLSTEEYDVVMRTKNLKSQYRDQHGELQMVRSEVDYTQQLVNACATELLKDFNNWYRATYAADDFLESLDDVGDDAMPGSPTGSTTSSSSTTAAAAGGRSPLAALPPPHGAPQPAATAIAAHLAAQPAPPRKVLTSLPASRTSDSAGDAGDAAAAFYSAQQQLLARNPAPTSRPGAVKQRTQMSTFTTTQR